VKRTDHSVVIVIAIWSVVMGLLLLAGDYLLEIAFVFAPLLQLFWLLLGVGVLAFSIFCAGWRGGVAAILAGGLLVISSPFLSAAGGRGWAWISLQSHKAVYDRVVAQAATLPDQGQIDGRQYFIERGPPIRVAFPQPVGVADNWGAVVHDSSGAVAAAKGWTGKPQRHTVRPDLQELWGGDLVTCRRIVDDYYRCWFT